MEQNYNTTSKKNLYGKVISEENTENKLQLRLSFSNEFFILQLEKLKKAFCYIKEHPNTFTKLLSFRSSNISFSVKLTLLENLL